MISISDTDAADYKPKRYDKINIEIANMFVKIDWKKDPIEGNTPVHPILGWEGADLLMGSAPPPEVLRGKHGLGEKGLRSVADALEIIYHDVL